MSFRLYLHSVNDSKEKISTIVAKISNTDPFQLLIALDEYINTINTDPFLSQVLLLMQQYHRQESAELAEKISDAHTDLYYIQDEIQEDIEKKYPLYALRQMLRIQRDFQYIKCT